MTPIQLLDASSVTSSEVTLLQSDVSPNSSPLTWLFSVPRCSVHFQSKRNDIRTVTKIDQHAGSWWVVCLGWSIFIVSPVRRRRGILALGLVIIRFSSDFFWKLEVAITKCFPSEKRKIEIQEIGARKLALGVEKANCEIDEVGNSLFLLIAKGAF